MGCIEAECISCQLGGTHFHIKKSAQPGESFLMSHRKLCLKEKFLIHKWTAKGCKPGSSPPSTNLPSTDYDWYGPPPTWNTSWTDHEDVYHAHYWVPGSNKHSEIENIASFTLKGPFSHVLSKAHNLGNEWQPINAINKKNSKTHAESSICFTKNFIFMIFYVHKVWYQTLSVGCSTPSWYEMTQINSNGRWHDPWMSPEYIPFPGYPEWWVIYQRSQHICQYRMGPPR